MIVVSAGHHTLSPGIVEGDFCEHDQALRWVKQIADLDSSIVGLPSMILKDKIKAVNARRPALAVDIHFNAGPIVESGKIVDCPLIAYHPTRPDSIDVADKLLCIFEPVEASAIAGYYKFNIGFGVDYFLESVSCASVLLIPGTSKTYAHLDMYRVCNNLVNTLRNYYV